MSEASVSARIWVSQPNQLNFPEAAVDSIAARPSAALCLSGGGSRAMSASLGYLRALTRLGLIDRFSHLSTVSGGSWAGSIFTYYRAGASDDAALLDLGLGSESEPASLDLARLAEPLPAGSMAEVITHSLRDAVLAEFKAGGEQTAWNRAVARIYLEPFGLVDPERVLAPCLDAATRDAILARPGNQGVAGLEPDNFIFPRAGRPFHVINACIVEPADHRPLAPQNPVSLQVTPLYAGSPQPLEVHYEQSVFRDQTLAMGGGLVETFAFGGSGPARIEGQAELASVAMAPEQVGARQTLEFAVGTSSAAYGAVVDKILGLDKLAQLTPQAPYWPVREGEVPAAKTFDVADGGVLENYGVLAMLQRKVAKAVVCISTDTALDLDFDPSAGEDERDRKVKGTIDPYLPNLFGVEVASTGTDLQNNTVFEREAFFELFAALQDKRRAGGPVVVRQKLAVQANAWWGIEDGWEVDVVWVYLERVPNWEALVPADTREAIDKGNRKLFDERLLRHFPHYKTAGENAFEIVELTPTQVRALAALSDWVVESSAELLREFLA